MARAKPLTKETAKHPLTVELLTAMDGVIDTDTERVLRKIDRRLTTYPELWGAGKVADYLGVLQTNVRKEKDLPPAAYPDLPRGQMWDAAVVRAKYRNRRKPKVKS